MNCPLIFIRAMRGQDIVRMAGAVESQPLLLKDQPVIPHACFARFPAGEAPRQELGPTLGTAEVMCGPSSCCCQLQVGYSAGCRGEYRPSLNIMTYREHLTA